MSTPNEDELQGTACPIETAVTWPYLFWGMITFALMSMSQPSGSVCGSAAEVEIGFLLRSSPIVCLIDTFLIIWKFMFLFLDARAVGPEPPLRNKLEQAIKQLITFRFQHELWRNPGEEPVPVIPRGCGGLQTTSFSDSLNNRFIRWAIFIINITSLVKLYGYRGIIGTQVLATMYLVSYLVTELMVLWPRRTIGCNQEAPPGKRVKSSGLMSLTFVGIAINEILVLYCLAVAFHQRFGHPGQNLYQWICLAFLCVGAAYAIPLFLYSVVHSSNPRGLVLPGLLLPFLFVLPLPFTPYLGDLFLPDMELSAWAEHSLAVVICITWVFVLLTFSSWTTEFVRGNPSTPAEKPPEIVAAKKRVEVVTGCFFLALNIVTCLLYYMFGYNSDGTSKPAWIEYMG